MGEANTSPIIFMTTKNYKFLIFYLGTGLLIPQIFSYAAKGGTGSISFFLGVVSIATALMALNAKRLTGKHLPRIALLLLCASAFFIHYSFGQIVFSVLDALCIIYIQAEVAKQEGGSLIGRFGNLTFLASIANAVSIFAGGLMSEQTALVTSLFLLLVYLIL